MPAGSSQLVVRPKRVRVVQRAQPTCDGRDDQPLMEIRHGQLHINNLSVDELSVSRLSAGSAKLEERLEIGDPEGRRMDISSSALRFIGKEGELITIGDGEAFLGGIFGSYLTKGQPFGHGIGLNTSSGLSYFLWADDHMLGMTLNNTHLRRRLTTGITKDGKVGTSLFDDDGNEIESFGDSMDLYRSSLEVLVDRIRKKP